MKPIYHHYKKWEDYKFGLYNTSNVDVESIKMFFKNRKLTQSYMEKVLNEWKFSCEQKLTNSHHK